jgi:predicted cytidylate kinase
MHISITGDLGSGKSTVAKEICRILNFKYLSTGLIQRELGQQRGMNTLEFNKFTDDNKDIDDYIDQKLKDVNNQEEPFVLDSRLGWHFVKKSFKVYLMAIDEVAASRVIGDEKRIGEPSAIDIQQKIKDQRERRKSENDRFEKNYGVKPSIFSDFDAVIDTSSATVSEVTNLILSLFEKYKANEIIPSNIWLSPQRIFPTEDVSVTTSSVAKEVRQDVEKNGFNPECPISCVLFKKDFFVFDGHKRLSASLFNKSPFIPVKLVAKNEETVLPSFKVEQFVSDALNISWLNDWEEAHHYKFFHYPENQIIKT